MRSVRVPLSRACQNACVFCEAADRLDRAPVPAAEVRTALDAARASGAAEVVLTGGEPTLSAHVVKAIAYAHALGLRTSLATNGRFLGDPEKLGRLVAAGLDAALISLHAVDPEVHRVLVGGDPVAHAQTTAGLRLAAGKLALTVRTVLTRLNLGELRPLIDLAAEVGAAFELRALARTGAAARRADLRLDPDDAIAAWRTARAHAAARGVPFRAVGFDALGLLDRPVAGPPVVVDAECLAMLEAGLHDRAMLAGLVADDRTLAALAGLLRVPVAEVGHVLATRRLPVLSLPPSLGGATPGGRVPDGLGPDAPLPAWEPLPAGARVAVVVGPRADALQACSTLPALAEALRRHGLDVALHTPWRTPFDPNRLDAAEPRSVLRAVGRLLARDDRPLHPEAPDADPVAAWARRAERLDLDGTDVVIVGSAADAAAVRALPGGRSVRLVVLDTGLLADVGDALGPDDRIVSPFPAAARAYLAAGLPLRRVHWRPEPVHFGHLPAVEPDGSVLIAGGDAVDPGLVRAVGDLGVPVRVVDGPDVGPRVTGTLADRLAAIARARLVWLPVRAVAAPAVARAASLALAAGRPVVATETPLTADHLRAGHAVLVRPEPAAHADALRALLADTGALDALAAGARARREVVDVARLAAELAGGAPPVRVVPGPSGGGPYGSW